MVTHITDLDTIARQLAASAGIFWDDLNDYPGYTKNIWRDQAQTVINAISAGTAITKDQRPAYN